MEPTDQIRYLTESQTRELCSAVDTVAAVREALALHATGLSSNAPEAHLPWTTSGGQQARSLNMPGWLAPGDRRWVGTKIVNSCLGNPAMGLPRASGITALFDWETARVGCVLAASSISAIRTASVTIAAAEELAVPAVDKCAVLGAGTIAEAHVRLIRQRWRQLKRVEIFDVAGDRSWDLVRRLPASEGHAGAEVAVASSWQQAVADAMVVIAATTTRTAYLALDQLSPGATVVNVSLDDVIAHAFLHCDRLFVDDWALIRQDPYRLLGRMARDGLIAGPGDAPCPAGARRVDGELGQLFAGRVAGRADAHEVILVNPFGMAIEDIAIAARVAERATVRGIGTLLPR